MELSLVVARSLNNVIGRGSEIPWRVKGEQQLFKRITMGGTLIMGRKTFESIGRPLPGRETVVITHNADLTLPGCHVAHSLTDALAIAETLGRPAFVVGGGEIYRQSMDLVASAHISTIALEVEGDIFFTGFREYEFRLVKSEFFESNINYQYQYFERVL